MYLHNKRLGRITKHIRLGMNPKGRVEFKCTETGDIRTYSLFDRERREKRAKERYQDIEVHDSSDLSNSGGSGPSNQSSEQSVETKGE